MRVKVERRNSEGTTETTISASATAALSAVTAISGGRGKPGRKRMFSPAAMISRRLRAVRPEGELVTAAAVKREGDGGSPGAGTQNSDAAHADFFSEAGFRAC